MIRDPGGTPLGQALTDSSDITEGDIRDAKVVADRAVPRAYPCLHATLLPGEEQRGTPLADES